MPKVTIKFAGTSSNWKDRMAGWHKYLVTYTCTVCGKDCKEYCWGPVDEIREVYSKPTNQVCDACVRKIEARS